LHRPRDASRPPLVAVSFNLDPKLSDLPFAGLACEVEKNPKHFVNFELNWNLVDLGGDYRLECEFNTDLFDAATVARWADHFATLLAAAVARPETSVGALPLLSDAEHRQILDDWNATAAQATEDALTLPELVAIQAAHTPDAPAVTCGDERLT